MSPLHRLISYGLLLLLLLVGADASTNNQALSGSSLVGAQVQAPALEPVYQGDCGSFVSQCYKTCFSLGQVRVAYACSLSVSSGLYSAHCGCGSTDETNVVLSLAGIPTTVTQTIQTTATNIAVLTATSTASTTTTTITTVQTSVCSYATIASTVLVTTTITAPTTTVTTFTTATAPATTGVYTSSVPAVVVSSGTLSKRKRLVGLGANSFCNDIQVACTVGCAAMLSTAAVQYCQAIAQTQYSVACICKNNVNVVQQVIQAFNLLRPAAQKCTSVATTKVAATVTATATSATTVVVTSKVTVVPTTVVSVYTSVVSTTSTYACYTTISTTSVITSIATPVTTTTVTTVATAVTTRLYYVSVTVSGQAGPSYIAQTTDSYGLAAPASATGSAQVFAILQDTSSDTLYNLVGVGPGIYQGRSLGLEAGYASGDDASTDDRFYAYLEPLTTQAQAPASQSNTGNNYDNPAETAVWQIDLVSLVAQLVWTSPAGSNPSTTSLEGFEDPSIKNSIGGAKSEQALSQWFPQDKLLPASFSLLAI